MFDLSFAILFCKTFTNNICQGHFLNFFFNRKIFFGTISNIVFFKNVFIFRYSYVVTNLKFRIFLIIFFLMEVNVCARLYINRLHFGCAMLCIFINYFINFYQLFHQLLYQCTFDIEIIYLQIFFFKVLINFSSATDLAPFYVK